MLNELMIMDSISIRKDVKRRKPEFRRQDSHKKKRVSRTGYRKPKGIQSKVRLNKRGYVKMANQGYGSPVDVKGMHPKGLFPFIVENVSQISSIDSEKEGAVIASGVGERKRIDIVKEALSRKVTLLNVKDPEGYLNEIEQRMKDKKKSRESLKAEKKKKEEKKKEKEKVKSTVDAQKEAEAAQEAAQNTTQDTASSEAIDENKKKEKEEKDKVLTKKE